MLVCLGPVTTWLDITVLERLILVLVSGKNGSILSFVWCTYIHCVWHCIVMGTCGACTHVTRAQWKQSHLWVGTACKFLVPALGVLAFLSRCLYTLLCRSGARRGQPNRSTPNNEKYFRISSSAASQHKELPGARMLEPGRVHWNFITAPFLFCLAVNCRWHFHLPNARCPQRTL